MGTSTYYVIIEGGGGVASLMTTDDKGEEGIDRTDDVIKTVILARHLGLEKLKKVAINVTCASFSMRSFIHFIWPGINAHNREHTYLSSSIC